MLETLQDKFTRLVERLAKGDKVSPEEVQGGMVGRTLTDLEQSVKVEKDRLQGDALDREADQLALQLKEAVALSRETGQTLRDFEKEAMVRHKDLEQAARKAQNTAMLLKNRIDKLRTRAKDLHGK